MTADNGKMQAETMAQALEVVTAHMSGDDELVRATIARVKHELDASPEHGNARTYVYVYQAGLLTELALGLYEMASGKSREEALQALAGAIASQGFGDPE